MPKVLLVEDDNNLREIYEARLQAEGYEISSAQDGEQALVVAKEFQPDLIISDVMMPKISGFEMLDILRNTEGLKNTRVIMLTALGQAEDKSRADSLGADRYLVKSQVTLEDIVTSAHQLLDDPVATPAINPAATENSSTDAPFMTPSSSPFPPTAEPAPVQDAPTVVDEPVASTDAAPVPISAQPGAIPTSDTAMPVAEPPAEPSEPAVEAPAVEPAPISLSEPEQPAAADATNNELTATSAAATPAAPEAEAASVAPTVMPAADSVITPTVAPAPVEVPPTTEPAAEPTPAIDPAAATPSSTAEAPAAPSEGASGALETNTVATEQASVNQQIEDFIKNTDGAPAPQESSPQTADDQLMADALDDLASSAPQPAAPTAPETQVSDTPAVTPTQPDDSDRVGVSHKKVIQPLESAPKPDINDLLAREEAMEAATSQAAPVTGDSTGPTETAPTQPHQPGDQVTPQGDTQPASPKRPDDFDPNSIAL